MFKILKPKDVKLRRSDACGKRVGQTFQASVINICAYVSSKERNIFLFFPYVGLQTPERLLAKIRKGNRF